MKSGCLRNKYLATRKPSAFWKYAYTHLHENNSQHQASEILQCRWGYSINISIYQYIFLKQDNKTANFQKNKT